MPNQQQQMAQTPNVELPQLNAKEFEQVPQEEKKNYIGNLIYAQILKTLGEE